MNDFMPRLDPRARLPLLRTLCLLLALAAILACIPLFPDRLTPPLTAARFELLVS